MLGVLKRRWKPTRRASGDRGGGTDTTLGSELPLDKPRPMPSPRQIHPLYGEKAGLLNYYDNTVGNVDNFPPAPNIVVEGGRIEFMRHPHDGSAQPRKHSTSRASQTYEQHMEKSDPLKREAAQRDAVERERRQRVEAEARLREAAAEVERTSSRVRHLQRELDRMEENTRELLQHKQRAEQLKQEKTALTLSYEARIEQFQSELAALRLEKESMRAQVRGLEAACLGEVQAALLGRLASLENEHAALARDADSQRRQYERCLDEVANQVVRALLSQKALREEIGTLQRRIRELETQNRRLSGLAQAAGARQQQGAGELGGAALLAALGLEPGWLGGARPRSLGLRAPASAERRAAPAKDEPEGSESPESGNRDEGYSTMSSDVQGAPSEARAAPAAAQDPRGLEDLKEAADESDGDSADSAGTPRLRPLGLGLGLDLDLDLELELALALGPAGRAARHSFPPGGPRAPLAWPLARSLSDSQLCLRLALSMSMARCGSSLLLSVDEEAWDAEYLQQWLRLDDSRQRPAAREPPLELGCARADLEDWSLELSGSSSGSEDAERRVPRESRARRRTPVSPGVGTDFTRDFYRLVKFESSRSLASSSSEREAAGEPPEEAPSPPAAPEELGAVPEEDEEAATSSTPSTVVSAPARAGSPRESLLVEGRERGLGFHERATSKDVIDELNRMIRSGEEAGARHDALAPLDKLDLACCCPTGWVHIERDIDFTDPKARANLLDVMLASSESSSATSSSGSAASDSGDEPADYRHLHRLHRYRRQRKASALHAHRVLRLPSNWGSARPSIIGRGGEFFVRYGDKEREAVAYFDFLNDIPLTAAHPPQQLGAGNALDLLDPANGPGSAADRTRISPL
ncbi:uncharacterized protein LOC131669567 isoform X2 [Phymastichus coffea]|uniref:uncharacterized protein LOC131669567 isoform X2 n=1 Tax=Phymastichus coffea TaxID=108790 RepID=UPI00273B36E4|nr:uncharacterized protein LOC131669567 isoform X2 [Phymastichus coffea]